MKTNEDHVRLAVKMFQPTSLTHLDTNVELVRLLSMTEGKGPLTLDEFKNEFDGIALKVALMLLQEAIGEGIIELRRINDVPVYSHTKYFEDLVFWQKVKAGLLPRPQKKGTP